MATLGLSDPLRDLYLSLLDFSLDLEDQSDAAVQEADHLATQLEAKSQEFASLLDKPSRNEISRRTVTSGISTRYGRRCVFPDHLLTSLNRQGHHRRGRLLVKR